MYGTRQRRNLVRVAQKFSFSSGRPARPQRLALACALVGDPDLLFLDEPTTGLDPQAHRRLWDLIEEFKRAGRTILLTAHYMDDSGGLRASGVLSESVMHAHLRPEVRLAADRRAPGLSGTVVVVLALG
jgi:ABC-type Mn2+/Zn2+ transport system ATPase subunit